MIDAFLRSRKGQINIVPHISPLFSIHIGLPQGSVLSPVLFIIFITLIVTSSSNFSNSVTIKKEFAKVFPLKRPTYAFTTGRVYFHLEFLTETEATENLEKWNHFSFVIKVSPKSQPG